MKTKLLISFILLSYISILNGQFNFDSEKLINCKIPHHFEKKNDENLYQFAHIIGNKDSIKLASSKGIFYIGSPLPENRIEKNLITDLYYDKEEDIFIGFIGATSLKDKELYKFQSIKGLRDGSINSSDVSEKELNLFNATGGLLAEIFQPENYKEKYNKQKLIKLYNKHCGIISIYFIYNEKKDIGKIIHDFSKNKIIKFSNKCKR